MASHENQEHRRDWNFHVSCLLFFVCYYLYVFLYLDPRSIYQSFESRINYPVFSTGWLFLKTYLLEPGGLIKYLTGFLSQCFYFSWLGALIITAVAVGICLCTGALITLAGGKRSKVLRYIPSVLLLVIYSNYDHPLGAGLSLLITLSFCVLYEKSQLSCRAARAVLFTLMLVILYYITGIASVMFALLAGMYQLAVRKRLFIGGFCLLCGLAVPWLIGTYIFDLKATEEYLSLLQFSGHIKDTTQEDFVKNIICCLYLFIPIVIAAVTVWNRWIESRVIAKESAETELSGIKKFLRSKIFQDTTKVIVLFSIAFLSVYFSLDNKRRNLAQIAFLSRHHMWSKVIDRARQISPYEFPVISCHDVARALYHTGRLSSEQFSFPQAPHTLLLIGEATGRNLTTYIKKSEISLELGIVSRAEKEVHEFLEMQTYNPFAIKLIAMINIIKRQPKTARVYLEVLSKDLIYGREAKDLLRRIDEDPQFITDKGVQYTRSIMNDTDNIFDNFQEEILLKRLLSRNRHNKMAFEYLMSHYLLTRQLDKFVENINRLDDFDYENIPRHYEEALMIYMNVTGKRPGVPGRKISQGAIRRYRDFHTIRSRFQNDIQSAFQALTKEYGRSYYFYFAFNFSGVTE